MNIIKNDYNVAVVSTDVELTSGTKTEVGTKAEFDKIVPLINRSGLMVLKANVDGADMKGSMLANYFTGGAETGIDFGGMTNFGGSPHAITGTVSLENDKCYVIVNIIPLSGAAKSSTRKI